LKSNVSEVLARGANILTIVEEGIEKEEADFAAEVAAMAGN